MSLFPWRASLAAVCLVAAAVSWTGCGGRTAVAETAHRELTVGQRAAVDHAVDQVKPALVRIHVVEPTHRQGREMKFVASGSGAIITPEGHIITNHHVAGKAVRIVCTMPNREEIPARLVGTDPATDVAVIQLMPPEPREFPVARFGDSDQLRAGDTVLALGSPLGLSQSVTLGIVSNTEMIIPSLFRGMSFELDGENVGELVKWIGHDAQIFGGNSGGPLINLDGEIIGVNEISFGLGGAIPGNLAREVAWQIIENGGVDRAYTGIVMQPLLKRGRAQGGALIANVLRDSPAQEAGIQPGDLLLSVGGTPIEARFYEDLPDVNNIMAGLPIDESVVFEIARGTERKSVNVTPVLRQPALQPTTEQRLWGLTARDLTVYTALDLNRDAETGVLVTSTRSGGPVAKAEPEIRRRDVITHLNGELIRDIAHFEEKTRNLVEGREEGTQVPVLVGYERDGESFLTVVEVGVEELDNPGADARRSWLPMETQVLTRDLAEKLGIEGTTGVRVTRVYSNRPENFPFEAGDLITHVDGDRLEASQTHDAEVFNTLIRQYRIGSEPEFRILRDGEEMTVTAELVPSPPRSREMRRFRDLDFEFVAREATFWDRENVRFRGVEVTVLADSVTEGGWASLGNLRVGDAILEIEGEPVTSLDDVQRLMKAVRETKSDTVVFKVRRGASTAFLEFEPFWESSQQLGTSITASVR